MDLPNVAGYLYPVTAGVTLVAGQFSVIAAGKLVLPTLPGVCFGINKETYVGAAAGNTEGEVLFVDHVWAENSTTDPITVDDIGKIAYVEDGRTVTGTGDTEVGIIVALKGTKVLVRFAR